MLRILTLVLCLASWALGDVITFNNGKRVEGKVLVEYQDEVQFKTALGVVTFSKKDISSIEKGPWKDPSEPNATNSTGARGRLPDAKAVRRAMSGRPWAKDIKQIPAVVISQGRMKGVPYISYRADEDFEVNIWGDPAAPVGVEVGLLNMRTRNEDARKQMQAFVAALMSDAKDREVIGKLSREKDDQVREGLTFEVMPPEAADSYHVWWMRVFDDRTLAIERGDVEQINAISMTRSTEGRVRPQTGKRRKPSDPPPGGEPWTNAEMRYARDLPGAKRGIARVYVREYIRKDGAYVKAHEAE